MIEEGCGEVDLSIEFWCVFGMNWMILILALGLSLTFSPNDKESGSYMWDENDEKNYD